MYRAPPTDEVAIAPPSLGTPPPAPQIDTALACLVIVARFHGIAVDPDQLVHEFGTAGPKS